MDDIFNKWCPARLIGPDVAAENAMEYIRRTDSAFNYCFSNARRFVEQFDAWLGIPEADWAAKERFRQAFGHIDLHHLGSHWIASASMDGPDGPVGPIGKVKLAKNFGKYPTIDEVESDLAAVASAFPWLAFSLGLWDRADEEAEGQPTHCWTLGDGKWARQEAFLDVQWPHAPDLQTSLLGVMKPPEYREVTWPISHLDKMWGDKVREARAVALQGDAISRAIPEEPQ